MIQTPIILYVEDDAGSRKVMHFLVNGAMGNPNLTIFEDSIDFLQRLHALQPRPNLVLLDIHVDPLDGFEILELIRHSAVFASVPVVALTASVMQEEVQRLKNAGFNGVIAKPIDVDHFPEQVDRILRGEVVWTIKK